MRTEPVELPAFAAPGEAVLNPVSRCIRGSGNFMLGGRPKQLIADRAAVQSQFRINQPPLNQFTDLCQYFISPDQERTLSAPPGKVTITGEEVPPGPSRQVQKERVLPVVTLPERVCRQGIISHQPEIPAERPEHSVNDESRFFPRMVRHGPRKVSSPRMRCRSARRGF